MPSGVRFRIDRRALAKAEVHKAAERAIADAAEHLLEQSNRTVPHEEGTLARSGEASHEGLKGAVSWDTPYAARQHEDLTLHHDQGRRAKWAEQTFKEERSSIAEFLIGEIRKAVG